jgi:DNA helicase IV
MSAPSSYCSEGNEPLIGLILLGLIAAGGALSGAMKKSSSSAPASGSTGAKSGTATRGMKDAAAREADDRNLQLKIKNWRAAWEPTVDRSRWIASHTSYRILLAHPRPAGSPGYFRLLRDLDAEFNAHNQTHLAMQKQRLKDFFDTIEKNPLTEEQIKACICMDHRVQIVAAAGSGKTSTMVAKAGYALREGLAQGNQILLLAFNTNAANELGERAQERLASLEGATAITAKTFHSFGLDVIAKATGKKPALAPWLDHPSEDIKVVVSIIDELCQQDQKFRNEWHFFRTVHGRDVGRWNVPAEPEAYSSGRRGFRTAQGELVKSKEERLIADWLFYHRVAYEYERPYEHDTASETHRQYYPDFYYPEIALYHEHFALNAAGEAPGHFGKTYTDGVQWKRQLHERMGTKLFETTSDDIMRGVALDLLEKELARNEIKATFDPNRAALGSQPVTAQEFAGTFRVFQQHVKCNGLTNEQLRAALAVQAGTLHTERLTRFVDLYERIAAEWEEKLKEGQYIDFEDMLIIAAEHVESGRFQSPYTLILSDEFQDSSRARIRLLKALADQQTTYLCVVGDDWQGINRFAGADISVMSEFNQIFPFATRLSLGTTFRCPQELCDLSSAFIQANAVQIKKTVTSANPSKLKNHLFAYAFDDKERADEHLAEQFRQIQLDLTAKKIEPGRDGRISVLLLGRYRNDCPAGLKRWQNRFRACLDIDFKTIHSSKGLEADYVMLLNVVEGDRGFPSQIEDDPILQIPMPAPDSFPMAEERRLFYVALTRARRQVRIFTNIAHPSRFLIELAKSGALVIEAIDTEALEPCPKCAIGVVALRKGRYGEFKRCSTWPRCDFKQNMATAVNENGSAPIRLTDVVAQGSTCPSCQRGQMIRKYGKYGEFLACSEFPTCKTTARMNRHLP